MTATSNDAPANAANFTEVEKPKLLCVDDETEITDSLKRLLISDFRVFTASSVTEAKEVLETNPDVAIVLSDQRMGDGTGLELLAFVREKYPETVRALLTAHVNLVAFTEAVNNSYVHRLILKPWDNVYLRAQMIEALAAHGGLREMKELERLAITDTVTLLKNHRFFQDQLKVEVERALRHNRDLSLIMVDIDHFKQLNDTYGHPAGDAVLRQVARKLQEGVRTLDSVSRYGGEEFALLLPDTSLDGALLVAERMRERMAAVEFSGVDFGPINLTISLGLASAPLHASSSQDLVRKADAALYRAKRQGRNQSVVATLDRPLD